MNNNPKKNETTKKHRKVTKQTNNVQPKNKQTKSAIKQTSKSSKRTKNLLFSYAKSIAPRPKYEAQAVPDKFSEGEFCIKILFLPVAHPELNPMELA